jgi:hypothetical protein
MVGVSGKQNTREGNMTDKDYEVKGFALDKETISRLDGLAVELYGELWHRSRSVIVNRLIRAARVENGLLVADEREKAPAE